LGTWPSASPLDVEDEDHGIGYVGLPVPYGGLRQRQLHSSNVVS